MLALGSSTEQTLQEKTRALRTELTTCLQDIARKVAPGSSSWELKDESYRDLKPKEWKNYTSKERELVEKKQKEVLARLPPPAAAELKSTPQSIEISKNRSENDETGTSRPVATTPKPIDSPPKVQLSPSIPAKRSAEEEAVNPARKVGGGIISTKKKSTRVAPREKSTPRTSPKETITTSKPSASKSLPPKKMKENSKFKSEEKILDSDTDSDVPLERQVRPAQSYRSSVKMEPKSSGSRGGGNTAVESEARKPTKVFSPPVSNSYRSRTSSSSSSTSHSPPKKRSPLATNEPITARRLQSPPRMSPPANASTRKRSREEDIGMKTDKRQRIEKENFKKSPTRRNLDNPRDASFKHETDEGKQKKISQEYHDLAERFRKLYPEYQRLHRRLQGLDTDGLTKEKSSFDRLIQMQEQLERWKAMLWKAAGETRHVGTTERSSGMVRVKV